MATPWVRMFPPEERECLSFRAAAGPKKMTGRERRPIDFFMLMFPMVLFREVVRQTNKYARHVIRRTVTGRHSRHKKWVPVTIRQMRAFIGIIINMGLIRKPSIESYWSKRPSQATPWFGTVMSRNRFQILLRFLHVADLDRIQPRDSAFYRPDSRFKPFLDFANRMFIRHYTPRQDVTVVETLVATRGRTAMLQYIPSKSAKFGVKFWVLAESATGYILRMNSYLGRTFEPAIAGLQGTAVVHTLLQQCALLGKGYHVTVDSFFCSLDLARRLVPLRTYITGTIRSNRPMPCIIKAANPAPGETVYARQGQMLLLAHKNHGRQKPVRCLSTGVTARSERGKPAILQHYNMTMGGVDYGDMLMSFYNAGRKTVKVWKKMVLNIIFRMALNAYVIYEQSRDRPFSRERFLQLLVEELCEEEMQERMHRQLNRPQRQRHYVRKRLVALQGKHQQRDCSVCSRRAERRRRSRMVCSNCRRGVHRRCLQQHVCAEE